MWGPSMVGFGSRPYTNTTGTNDWFVVGFSPRKAALTIYGVHDGYARPRSIARRARPAHDRQGLPLPQAARPGRHRRPGAAGPQGLASADAVEAPASDREPARGRRLGRASAGPSGGRGRARRWWCAGSRRCRRRGGGRGRRGSGRATARPPGRRPGGRGDRGSPARRRPTGGRARSRGAWRPVRRSGSTRRERRPGRAGARGCGPGPAAWRTHGSSLRPTCRASATSWPADRALVPPPMAARSLASIVRSTAKPSPSAPMRSPSAMKASSRNTSLKW